MLDGPLDAALLRANLRDLARVNRVLGGSGLTWTAIQRFLSVERPPLRLLDVGTGGADIPLSLVERARSSWYGLKIVATDIRPEIVTLARRATNGEPAIEVRLAMAGPIAQPDRDFDVVHASLVLHHLEPDDAAQLLGEMRRVARTAVVINDLDRGWRWYLGAWLLSRLATRNRYTRHDAPLSVRRAYHPDEVSRMAGRAGLREIGRYWTRPGYRYALVFVRST